MEFLAVFNGCYYSKIIAEGKPYIVDKTYPVKKLLRVVYPPETTGAKSNPNKLR